MHKLVEMYGHSNMNGEAFKVNIQDFKKEIHKICKKNYTSYTVYIIRKGNI